MPLTLFAQPVYSGFQEALQPDDPCRYHEIFDYLYAFVEARGRYRLRVMVSHFHNTILFEVRSYRVDFPATYGWASARLREFNYRNSC